MIRLHVRLPDGGGIPGGPMSGAIGAVRQADRMDILAEEIRKMLEKAGVKDPQLEKPPRPEMGDVALPCFPMAKEMRKSPADIENVVKEAALIATRQGKDQVDYPDMTKAIERIELGVEHRKNMTPREREMVAYHETGHLVILYLLHPTDDVFKASIISRGEALGVVHHSPREEFYTMDRQTYLANIKVALAGYVAEKLRFGTTSSGVAADFKNAMYLAHSMVWQVGMGGNGFLGDFSHLPESQISDSLKQRLNAETEKILKDTSADTERVLRQNWPIVERFVQELLAKEELDYDAIDAIFAEFGKGHTELSVPATRPSALPESPAAVRTAATARATARGRSAGRGKRARS